jgi:hypothetical protein
MLRFSPASPELCRLFKSRTYRDYIQSAREGGLPELLAEVEAKLGIVGLSAEGMGEPAGYVGTTRDPEAVPIYWRRT